MDEKSKRIVNFILAIIIMIVCEAFVMWFLTRSFDIDPDSFLWYLIVGAVFAIFAIIWYWTTLSDKGDPSNLSSRTRR